nr:sulfur carrier protein ThiS adenylyltransferase ThiF [Mucispirillum sp.]
VSLSYIINNNDTVALIKKGIVPDKEYLEYQLISRQGLKEYNILKNSSVAVCGLGGLGSNAAISLARAGVGRLKLIDFDIVEPSNINRQAYFIEHIGKNKTDALKEIINKISPYINIETVNIYLDEENILNELSGFQVILECFDNVLSKMNLIEKCVNNMRDSYIIGASGVAGYYNTDKLEQKPLGSNCIIIGDFENEAGFNQGLYAPRVAAAANIQANTALRYLLKDK